MWAYFGHAHIWHEPRHSGTSLHFCCTTRPRITRCLQAIFPHLAIKSAVTHGHTWMSWRAAKRLCVLQGAGMAALRGDLEADEPQRQATALLQLLNAVAGGRDVASLVAYACQGIVRGPAAPTVKRLAYELVRPSSGAAIFLSMTAHAFCHTSQDP